MQRFHTPRSLVRIQQELPNKRKKIMSLTNGIVQVQNRQFIVGSIDKDGYFSISSRPATHATLNAALVECNRLAASTPGKAFIAMQLAGGAYLPNVSMPANF